MYKSFTAENFRCFDKLHLDDLQRINLISGKNNVGKTALLEALFIYAGAYTPEFTIKINSFRGIEQFQIEQVSSAEMPWDSIFRGFDISGVIRLMGAVDEGAERELSLSVVGETERELVNADIVRMKPNSMMTGWLINQPIKVLKLESTQGEEQIVSYAIFAEEGFLTLPLITTPHPIFFNGARMCVRPTTDAERLSNVSRQDESRILEVLQVIEPDLQGVEVRNYQGTWMVHGDTPFLERPIPLTLMGEGLARLTSLVLSIANAEGGVVLIDEIENGLHYSVLVDIWRALAKAARHFDVQLFATTHSFEMIRAAYRAFRDDDPYDFKLYRLDRINGTIKALAYDRDTLEVAIDTGLEVR